MRHGTGSNDPVRRRADVFAVSARGLHAARPRAEVDDEASAKEAEGMANHSQRALEELEFKRMLSGELDPGGAIIQITAGAGGVDASD